MRMLRFAVLLALTLPGIFAVGNAAGSGPLSEYRVYCEPGQLAMMFANFEEEIEIPATLEFQGQTWTKIRMRIRGDGTRKVPKKSLRFTFPDKRFADGREVLNLNSDYLDLSYIRNFVSSRLMRESGQPCFDAEYGRLFINDELYGVYIKLERIDEDFLRRRGMDPEGNLYKAALDGSSLSPSDNLAIHWEKKTNSNESWDDLRTFIRDINTVSDSDYLQFTKTRLDYDKMVNVLAMNMLLSNGSTYFHNYYMYHDVKGSGRWTMIPWDMDVTLGSHFSKHYPYHKSSSVWTDDNPFLERALICDTIFNAIQARVQELAGTIFTPEFVNPIIDSVVCVLRDAVEEDEKDNIASVDDWLEQIDHEKNFVANRSRILLRQLATWPRPFRVANTPDIFTATDTIRFHWQHSQPPPDQEVRYRLVFSPDKTFQDEDRKVVVDGLRDTSLTITALPAPGRYFWFVEATVDDKFYVEGTNFPLEFVVADGSELPTEIEGELLLRRAESPYQANSDVYIRPGAVLRAEAGVEIRMAAGSSIYVEGRLELLGQADAPLRLRPSLADQRWGALVFQQSEGRSLLRYCKVEGASVGGRPDRQPAAISVHETLVDIEHCDFIGCGQSIAAEGGRLGIVGCRFHEGNFGDQINLRSTTALIEDCHFFAVDGGDAIDLEFVNDVAVRYCRFWGGKDDAIDVDRGKGVVLEHNVVHDFSDNGITASDSSELMVYNCIVSASGGGLEAKGGARIRGRHLTLYANEWSLRMLEQEQVPGGGDIELENSILAAGKEGTAQVEGSGQYLLRWSLLDTELAPGEGNLSGDPQLLAPADGKFDLRPNSPCLDAANPEGAADPDGSRPDMGAQLLRLALPGNIVINEINYNSAAGVDGGDWIELFNRSDESLDLGGWQFKDADEGHQFTLPQGSRIAPRGFLILCQDAASFAELYPQVASIQGDLGFGLSAKGELLRLYDDQGSLVDSLVYDDNSPWPSAADGRGPTLELLDASIDNARAQSWLASVEQGGTPGAVNSRPLLNNVPPIDPRITESQGLRPSPNPARDQVVLTLPNIDGRVESLALYSRPGHKLWQAAAGQLVTNAQRQIVVPLEQLASGSYLCSVKLRDKAGLIRMLYGIVTVLR